MEKGVGIPFLTGVTPEELLDLVAPGHAGSRKSLPKESLSGSLQHNFLHTE